MKTHNTYPEYKTARQWAKMGYLPKDGATGIELWANRYCQDKYTYYSPLEVEPASPEQVRTYFAPERERKNLKARERRADMREHKARELIRDEIRPRIEELTARYSEAPPALDNVLVIDTETTGLTAGRDDILQLSVIDGTGAELYNSYFRPCAREWTEAQKVNHIRPADVENAPRISEILAKAHKIIGYNLPFDLEFLDCCGVLIPKTAEIVDVMELFAPIYGEWSEKYNSYKWQKLTTAARYYGYDWSAHGKAHDSRADCYATLYVYNKIQETACTSADD